MEIKLVPTCAGYCLALNGVAHNGKGLRANVEAMLNELGAVYEYDDVATSVKIISLEKMVLTVRVGGIATSTIATTGSSY